MLAAGADEVSAAVAALFGSHALMYQALSAQAATFHSQFVQLMNAGAGLYAAAKAANASPLDSADHRATDPQRHQRPHRGEEVADQLSAFMLLTPGADGKPYPNGVCTATDTAQDWKLSAQEAGDANDLPFWDGHSMDITRMYNWECWIYGSDPVANANIVTSGDTSARPTGFRPGCR